MSIALKSKHNIKYTRLTMPEYKNTLWHFPSCKYIYEIESLSMDIKIPYSILLPSLDSSKDLRSY